MHYLLFLNMRIMAEVGGHTLLKNRQREIIYGLLLLARAHVFEHYYVRYAVLVQT